MRDLSIGKIISVVAERERVERNACEVDGGAEPGEVGHRKRSPSSISTSVGVIGEATSLPSRSRSSSAKRLHPF